jgi:hypothetical protein
MEEATPRPRDFCRAAPQRISHSATVDGLRYHLRESCQAPRPAAARRLSPRKRWILALRDALGRREHGLFRAATQSDVVVRPTHMAQLMRAFQLALRFITSTRTMRDFAGPHPALDAFFAENGGVGESPGFRKSVVRTALDVLEPH